MNGSREDDAAGTPAHIEQLCGVCGAGVAVVDYAGIRDWEYATPGEWQYLRCLSCGIISLYPFPDEDTVRGAYPDDYSSWTEQPGQKNILHRLRALYITYRDRKFADFIRPSGSVLDVGCGDGATLERIHAFTTGRVIGVDFSSHAVSVARSKGLDVRHGTLSSLTDEVFDLILMIDYLEHSMSPRDDVAHAYRLLNDNGKLYGVVPNYASIDRRLFGPFWGGTHAPRHLFQFTSKTLTTLLVNEGFRNIVLSHSMSPTTPALSVQNWCQSRHFLRTRLECGRAKYYPILLAAAIPLQVVLSLLGFGGFIEFVAER